MALMPIVRGSVVQSNYIGWSVKLLCELLVGCKAVQLRAQ